MPDDRIAKLLGDIRSSDQTRFELVEKLRQEILTLDPAVSEEVKYGGFLFSVDESFCGIFSYSKHVSLEFGSGALLPDKHNVLEGKGKFRRHIKIFSVSEITGKHVREYLLLALEESANL